MNIPDILLIQSLISSAFISDKNDAIDYARMRLNHLFLTNFYKCYQRLCKGCTRKTFM